MKSHRFAGSIRHRIRSFPIPWPFARRPSAGPGRVASPRPALLLVLDPEGTATRHMPGVFEPKGLRMAKGENDARRFVPDSVRNDLAPEADCSDGWHDGSPIDGVNGWVEAIVPDGSGGLIVGGSFNVAGNVFANNIARWDGSKWSSFGAGLSDNVTAIAVSGTDVYVGGFFTAAGGTPANYVAKWNGSSWTPLGSGPGYLVYGLTISGSKVYVAGSVFHPGTGTATGYVSMWDGSNWSTLGSGMDGHVGAVAVSGTAVYAAGRFRNAGGTAVNQYCEMGRHSFVGARSGAGRGCVHDRGFGARRLRRRDKFR